LAGGARVDDRRFTSHGNRLFDGCDLEVEGQFGIGADAHFHTLAHDGAEARERSRDFVRAGSEIEESELARFVGDRARGAVAAGDRHSHAGEDAALLVHHRAGNAATSDLGERHGCCDQHQRCCHE
jgi:hypothetical protein